MNYICLWGIADTCLYDFMIDIPFYLNWIMFVKNNS